MGGAGILTIDNPAHLLQFRHQVGAGMQPSRRIHNQHIGPPGLAGLVSVISHRPRIGPGLMADYLYTGPVAEDFQLLLGRRPKGVGRPQDDLFALLPEVIGQFGDAGSLAHAVDAHHQNDIGRRGNGVVQPGRRIRPGFQVFNQGCFQAGKNGVRAVHPLGLGLGFQVGDNPQGSIHPHIGGNQDFLQLLPNRFIQFSGAEKGLDAAEPLLAAALGGLGGAFPVGFPVALKKGEHNPASWSC